MVVVVVVGGWGGGGYLNSVSCIYGDLVIGVVPVGKTQVVILYLQVQVGEDELQICR